MSEPPLGHTTINDIPNNEKMNTIRLLTPVIRILNSLTALPANDFYQSGQPRIYNIFSISMGFAQPLNFSFELHIQSEGLEEEIEGVLLVEVKISRNRSEEDFYEGELSVIVTALAPFPSKLQHAFEVKRTSGHSTVEYNVVKDKITFSNTSMRMVSRWAREVYLDVEMSGSATASAVGCLVGQAESLISADDVFTVTSSEASFCQDYCQSEYRCNYYCANFVKLTSNNSRKLNCNYLCNSYHVSPFSFILREEKYDLDY